MQHNIADHAVLMHKQDAHNFIDVTDYYVIRQTTRQLIHVKKRKCLQKSTSKETFYFIKLVPCRENSSLQKWTLEHRRESKYR